MKHKLRKINSKIKLVKSWNLTYEKEKLIYFPKNENELKFILNYLKRYKKKYSIKTGQCSYDGKSLSLDKSNIIISLKNFNKLIKINKKKKIIQVQAGAKILDILLELKKIKLTMFSVPGGDSITVGGAIAANVIGKDSSKNFASFGDSVESLNVMKHDGTRIKLKFNSKKKNLFIGSFGFFGIILDAELKVRKIPSQNLLLLSSKVRKFNDVVKFLNKKFDYKYIVIDPFFRKDNLGIFFHSHFVKDDKNYFYKKVFEIYFLDKFLVKLSSFFINSLSWKLFYKLFILFSKKEQLIDLHNFHYSSKYKHLIPNLSRGGLVDYEILVKKNLTNTLLKIKDLFIINNIYPIFIIVKKIYKSKNKYFYSYNKNGYSVSIAVDKKNLNFYKKKEIENFIKKNNYEVNICKTDHLLIKNFSKKFAKFSKNDKKNTFTSIFKKSILNQND